MLRILTKIALWFLSITTKEYPATPEAIQVPVIAQDAQNDEIQVQAQRGLLGEDILHLQEFFQIPEYKKGDGIDKWIAASAQQEVIRYLNNNYRI